MDESAAEWVYEHGSLYRGGVYPGISHHGCGARDAAFDRG